MGPGGREAMPTFGSLFTGIGGIDLGLERAGWSCCWQVEIDPWCRRVLSKHWPDVPRHGDVRELEGGELEAVDLIAGGFPCQPVSLAGRRGGASDERWLWPEFARIVRFLRPRGVLVENVPGLLIGDGMAEVLGDLAALGYDAEWECIPAAAFGAPHLRWRIFIVAHSQCPGLEERVRVGSDAREERSTAERSGGALAHAHSTAGRSARPAGEAVFRSGALERSRRCGSSSGEQWLVEPAVGRVANGIPDRVERLRGLGNAVVPQVAEAVGRMILEAWQ